MKHDEATVQPAPLGQVERVVRRAVAVARWAGVIGLGVLLWMTGLAVLDVPAGLPQWRHFAGAALLVCAVHLWRRA